MVELNQRFLTISKIAYSKFVPFAHPLLNDFFFFFEISFTKAFILLILSPKTISLISFNASALFST